MYLLTGT